MLGKIEGRRKKVNQRTKWLDSVTDAMNMNLGKLQEMVRDRQGGLACYSTWGHKEIDITGDSTTILSTDISISC